jgi:hypothetical protein
MPPALVTVALGATLWSGCYLSHEPPCPGHPFSTLELPADAEVLFVQGDAPGRQLGTRWLPYHTVGAAISAAHRGVIVAIAGGTYDEDVRLPDGVTLWGVCEEETVLTSSRRSESDGVIAIDGAETGVRNVTIHAGELRPGVTVRGAGRDSTLLDVDIIGGADAAMIAESGGALDAMRFDVTGAEPCGLLVRAGGEMDARDGTISDTDVAVCTCSSGSEDYDVSRVTEDVVFRNNVINLDTLCL